MPSVITVKGKVLGHRRLLFTDGSVLLPPDATTSNSRPFTLRDLIVCGAARSSCISVTVGRTKAAKDFDP